MGTEPILHAIVDLIAGVNAPLSTVQPITELSGCIHTCNFLNYCVSLKVKEWVVYPFLSEFLRYFCLNNEGTEVQHKAGVNTKNHSHNS